MKELIEKYLRAKGAEEAAREERRRLTSEIAAQLEHPDEGQKTHKVDCYSVTIKGSVNRRVDWGLFDAVVYEHPPVKIKRELDAEGLRWLRDNAPDVHDEYLRAITSAPGQTQITIKERAE